MAINILIIVISADRLQIRGQHSIYSTIDARDFDFFNMKAMQTSPRMEKIERVLFLLAAFACFTSLMERFSTPFSLIFIFLLIAVILNILAYIFYKKLGRNMVVLAFSINGICNLFSGYDSFLRGSQRAYIITVLIGIVYILLGLFVWIMMAQPKNKNESDPALP